MRRDEISRGIRETECRELAAFHGLRRRQCAAGRIAGHVAKYGPVVSRRADEKTVGAVGTDKFLLSGDTERFVLSCCLRARGERVDTVSALFERRHDQRLACDRPFQRRVRLAGLPERRGGDSCEPDRLAEQSASGLFEHQPELGEAKPEAAGGLRNENTEPPEVAGFAKPRRCKTWIVLAKTARHLRPRCSDKFGGAVAQQRLLLCQMQFHDRCRAVRQLGRLSTRRASTLRWISDEPP